MKDPKKGMLKKSLLIDIFMLLLLLTAFGLIVVVI